MRGAFGERIGRLRSEVETRRRFTLPTRSRSILIVAGAITAILVFVVVVTAPPRPFHPGRDAELRATYAAYLDQGVLLVKPFGHGSPGTQWPTPTEFTYAVFDDDPGIFAAASLLGGAAGFEDPYTAIGLVQAAIAALPWFLLPLLIARIFMRPVAGYASVAALPLYALLAWQWAIVGTDYGRGTVGVEVYALYGVAGSLVFLGLTVALALVITRRSLTTTLAFGALLGVVAAAANTTRAVSGLAILLATAVAFLIRDPRWRWIPAMALPVALALALPALTMASINADRSDLTGLSADEVPGAHPVWHVVYLGLGYLGYGSNYQEPNPFAVRWSDEFAWETARAVDPGVQVHSDEYEEILRDLYFQGVRQHPIPALKGYLLKGLDVIAQNGAVLILIALVMVLGHRSDVRFPLAITGLIAGPVVLLGIAPPTAVMPFRYFFVELTAGLSLLFVVAVAQAAVLLQRPQEGDYPPTAIAVSS